MKHDPDQLVNVAALPAGEQSELQANALRKMRERCDELVSQNGPAMQDLRKDPTARLRKGRGSQQ